jgi:hypothetical protein
VKEKMRAGITPEEALRAARVEVGSLEAVKEGVRAVGWEATVETMLQDLRYGLRQLRRSPSFTAAAVLTLALGIGANSTIFSYVNALLLRPPSGVSAPDTLLAVWSRLPDGGYLQHSYPDYVYYRVHNRVFSDLSAYSSDPDRVSWTAQGQTELIEAQLVSGNFFSALGVKPVLGRWFLPEEDQVPGKDPVVVLNHTFWQQRLGTDPKVLGSTLTINAHSFSVVGVAPVGFSGVETGFAPDFWVPIMMQREIVPADDLLADRTGFWLFIVGRLKAGRHSRTSSG